MFRLSAVVFAGLLLAACQTSGGSSGSTSSGTATRGDHGGHEYDIVYPDNARSILSDYRSYLGANLRQRSRAHQGIDIAGPDEQAIIAMADGEVLRAETDNCWGPTVVVDHGPDANGRNLIALYGHVDEIVVSPGDTVTRGQLLARLGNNHNSYRCIFGVRHLHMQLGRQYYGGPVGTRWGHTRWLEDGARGVNPHQYWADGPGLVTCYEDGRTYPAGSLTYPLPCDGA